MGKTTQTVLLMLIITSTSVSLPFGFSESTHGDGPGESQNRPNVLNLMDDTADANSKAKDTLTSTASGEAPDVARDRMEYLKDSSDDDERRTANDVADGAKEKARKAYVEAKETANIARDVVSEAAMSGKVEDKVRDEFKNNYEAAKEMVSQATGDLGSKIR